MITTIEEILSRAALVQDPYTQADIDAAEHRLRERLSRPAPAPQQLRARPRPCAQDAARSLRTLCEAVLAATGITPLETFLADSMPHPLGARVLGCALQLTDCKDDARFWWQYAAGADDTTAHYCLYLHHLALDEPAEAAWWRDQITDTIPDSHRQTPPRTGLPVANSVLQTTADNSLATLMRVLSRLKAAARSKRLPAAVAAVLDYLPLALSHVDPDLDLPLPAPGFARHVRHLAGTAAPRPEEDNDERPADRLARRQTRNRDELAAWVASRTSLPAGSRVVSMSQGQLSAIT